MHKVTHEAIVLKLYVDKMPNTTLIFFVLNGQCESCDNDMKLDSLKIIRGQNAKYHIIFFFVLNGQCESCDNY